MALKVYSKSILVMKNDGSGTFSQGNDFKRKITANDFTLDGIGDIAIINGYISFAVLINNGSWKTDSENNQKHNDSKQSQNSIPFICFMDYR